MSVRNYTKLKINQSMGSDKNIQNNTSGSTVEGTDRRNDNMMNGYISGDRAGSSSAHQFHRSASGSK